MPLALLALLTATGCVSVQGTQEPRTPGLGPAGNHSSSPLTSPRPPVREELTSTGPEAREERDRTGGAKDEGRPAAQDPKDGVRHAPAPPRQAERPVPPVRRTPPRTGSPRKHRPAGGAVRPTRPRPGYDMAGLCRESAGVADPSLTALCRRNFGG
ncbi:hypothetical protein ACFU5O_06660 [Streptomyces sp. NPDC057445]|uniref:hypothetical protein n=1 Tax=Streptomyces sp. NPDC057445 TaxID=3346136 RepID=UPI0036AD55B9